MSEGQRLRQLLLDIQGKLTRLGATNRARWSCFSPDTELSQPQFQQRLSSFGINVPPQDVATLWRATGIMGERMQFSDFIKFLQAESLSIPNAPSASPAHSSLLDAMKSNTRTLLMKLIEADPSTTGFVTHRSFSDICSWFASTEDQTAIRQILAKYDSQNTGNFYYFYFLGDLCSDGKFKRPPQLNVEVGFDQKTMPSEPHSPYAPPSIDTYSNRSNDNYQSRGSNNNSYDSPSRGGYGGNNDSPSRGGYGGNNDSPSRGGYGGNNDSPSRGGYGENNDSSFRGGYGGNNDSPSRGGYGDSSFRGGYNGNNDSPSRGGYGGNTQLDSRSPRNSGYNSPSFRVPPIEVNNNDRKTTSGGRGRLDPSIFGDATPKSPIGSSSPSGGRGRLDPSIFGQRPQVESTPEQIVKHADDYVTADHIQGLSPNQLIEMISKQVSRVSRGSKQCYSRWRGSHDFLDATDLRDGLARDANIVIPLRDLQLIINQYGGPMNMSAFVRMLSDGTKFAQENSSIDGMRKSTEDEAALIRIADQVIGTQWEDMVFRSRRAEDIVRGFALMGVNTNESDIRNLTSKLGLNGFVDAIKARIQ